MSTWDVDLLLLFEQSPVRRESLAVALAVDEDSVAGGGEPVECAVALEVRAVEPAEPLFDLALARFGEAGAAATGYELFARLDRPLLVQPMQAEFIAGRSPSVWGS